VTGDGRTEAAPGATWGRANPLSWPEVALARSIGGSMLKKGEVIGVWLWGIAVWIILAFAFGDFWWFRPLYRQLF